MYNLVKVECGDKEYSGYNSIHPAYLTSLVSLFTNGYVNSSELNVSNIFSLNESNSLTGAISNPTQLQSSSAVGIYPFTFADGALKSVNTPTASSKMILYPVVPFDVYGNSTYSVESIDRYSFSVSQNFHYSPTSNLEFIGIRLSSFSIRMKYYDSVSGNNWYFPLAYITSKSLFNRPYHEIYPTESIKLTWVVDFENRQDEDISYKKNMKSTVNGVNAEIHNDLKYIFKEMLVSDNFSFDVDSSTSTEAFKITGIIGFTEPNKALYNNGSTADGTAYFMTPDEGTGTVSANIGDEYDPGVDDYLLTYFVSYTNKTGKPQRLGSLLLTGKTVDSVKSVVPISWINSKHLWDMETRILNPNERIELSWSVDLNGNKSNDTVAVNTKIDLELV